MHPLQVSAQFAAFVWFSRQRPEDPQTRSKARRLARKHWGDFLPSAHEGLGRLLLKIGGPRAHEAVAGVRSESKERCLSWA